MTPKLAQTLYQLGALVSAVLGIALIWGGIDSGAADSINQIIGGLVALIPGATNAVAGKRVSTQRNDGTFETVAPADQVINGVQAVIEAQAKAQTDIDRVKDVVTAVIGTVPVLGPLAQAAINAER